MEISWTARPQILQSDQFQSLPRELLLKLQHGSNEEYLNIVSELATKPESTTAIFLSHLDLFVDICGRWLSSERIDKLLALAALAKVVPVASHLKYFVRAILDDRSHTALDALRSRRSTALNDVHTADLKQILIAVYRLIEFDNNEFATFVSPAQLQFLLGHSSRTIRYLAVRILCLFLHASDIFLAKMVEKHLGQDSLEDEWEGKSIDYLFLTLWEEKRIKDLRALVVNKSRSAIGEQKDSNFHPTRRIIRPQDLVATSASIGRVLLPQLQQAPQSHPSLVMTETTQESLEDLGTSINHGSPILLIGAPGSGKTSIVRYAARVMGKEQTMINLHLNEQTDAKTLLGMYTSTSESNSFSWQPGILTQGVLEGRWVLIENLDRAPPEVISILLSLLEGRGLFITHWGESVRPGPGFALFATASSYQNLLGTTIDPTESQIGRRFWRIVHVNSNTDLEFATILETEFPILKPHVAQLIAVYNGVRDQARDGSQSLPTPRLAESFRPNQLFKWCSRIEKLFLKVGVSTQDGSYPTHVLENIFLDAVDVFAASVPKSAQRMRIAQVIAHNLGIPQAFVQHCLETRVPAVKENLKSLEVGRMHLSKCGPVRRSSAAQQAAGSAHFANTDQISRLLECLSASVSQAEPCLLVGETGTGKTAIVQKLASMMNQNLMVVNLSQQSEASDFLGGFKPVNPGKIAFALREEFEGLLKSSFPSKQNDSFMTTLDQAIRKGRWPRALSLLKDALSSVSEHFKNSLTKVKQASDEPSLKKRRLGIGRLEDLRQRWQRFETNIEAFERHLAGHPGGFAFSFVEGKLVQAVRNGHWIFLDEINLASTDTLEHLVDLISNVREGGPSVFLTDSGKIERVVAHADFRVFAAMNPATDVGKRDLPLFIRSRFTEIFFEPPDNNFDDLTVIVRAYLGSHDHTDPSLTHVIARLHIKLKALCEKHVVSDSTKQKIHTSLRTLTRVLNYAVELAPIYGLRRSLYEGFCMAYLTNISKDTKSLLLTEIESHILGSLKNPKALLGQVPRVLQDRHRYVQFRHYFIGRGPLPPEEQNQYVITPFVEQNLLNLARAVSTRKFPVLLQGPTSSGKTSMVEYLAKISGHKFIRINNHEHTDLQEYLGTYVSRPDGQLQYQEGLLIQALREGHWVVLDELNLAPSDVLEALNRLLDDNRELFVPETQQTIRPHENFMLFATQNPPGLYGGRKMLSRAFRNRFLELHFDDIPEDDLEVILRDRCQIAPSYCAKIVEIYKKLSIARQSSRLFEQRQSFATLRDLFRWASRDVSSKEELAKQGFYLLAEKVRNAEGRDMVKHIIEDSLRVSLNDEDLYSTISMGRRPKSPLLASGDLIWTKSMRRLYILITEALESDEPVLLVGETGAGKTSICQVVSRIMETELRIVNAHQNTETGDLIGALRPARQKTPTTAKFVELLENLLPDFEFADESLEHRSAAMKAAYKRMILESPAQVPEEIRIQIEREMAKSQALFEWSDGSLVQAMRNGHHYLLDEISLADDSVLERLNSVLESDRSLVLAEKGSGDVHITAAPGFQFLATMNPGNDYGKRELSPALRNRFTEIWVPAARDQAEVVEIVKAKLPANMQRLALPMVQFAEWFTSNLQNRTGRISIRDLLAWAQFIASLQNAESQFAIYHGCAMVYIDGLGANPANLSLGQYIDRPSLTRKCVDELKSIFDIQIDEKFYENVHLSLHNEELQIGSFSVKRDVKDSERALYSLEAPATKSNLLKLIRSLQMKKPVLIEGPPGVGKTSLISALSEIIGIGLTRINLSAQTELGDLFGSDVPLEGQAAGRFGWRDASFLQALREGRWVLLDEMNLASQTVLEGLNACLDHRGQVYISELDRTFPKHSDFMLFAAQNPYTQGGGRKGLPLSFVDRFTTVYIEEFSPEDLMVICQSLFPRVPTSALELLTKTTDAISRMVLQMPDFRSQGSPWEINLRDELRWLQLVTAPRKFSALTKPSDFTDLIFKQRFRTRSQRSAIQSVVGDNLPKPSCANERYYFENCDVVQVRHGYLEKNSVFCHPTKNSKAFSGMNLAATESVLICLQQRWPCLLVGASGSGKTALIQQIGDKVGADVIKIFLNSDMDATDILGGFEQFDARRRVASLFRAIQAYTKRAIIETMLSPAGSIDVLDSLEAHVQNFRSSSLAAFDEVRQALKAVASVYPSSDFADFAQQLEDIVSQREQENRARFEWVDGILVNAMSQGKWLILDNANLCNPAILDRLNPLLEPDGYLSIDECPQTDGRSRIVRPHPAFRIFMTMDPRHGELSRAMRNRCVEVFLSNEIRPGRDDLFVSTFDPLTLHFSIFALIDWNMFEDPMLSMLFSICFEHLPLSHHVSNTRWESQVLSGLLRLSTKSTASFESCIKNFQHIANLEMGLVARIIDLYRRTDQYLERGGSLQALQTIHPFNNPALLSNENPFSKDLATYGYFLDFLVDLLQFGICLARAVQDVSGLGINPSAAPQQSMLNSIEPAASQDSNKLLLIFLQKTFVSLEKTVQEWQIKVSIDSLAVLSFMQSMLDLSKDILDLAKSPIVTEATLQVYLSLGRSLVKTHVAQHEDHNDKTSLAGDCLSALTIFDAKKLRTGLAMDQIWRALRPETPTKASEVVSQEQIESLAARFDYLRKRANAPLQEQSRTQKLLSAIYVSLMSHTPAGVETIDEIRKAIAKAESLARLTDVEWNPLFSDEFDAFTQYQTLESGCFPQSRFESLRTLSQNPTLPLRDDARESYGWKTLVSLAGCAGTAGRASYLASFTKRVPISTLSKLRQVNAVPLANLGLLTSEIDVLGEAVATSSALFGKNQLLILDSKLKEYRNFIGECLRELMLETEFRKALESGASFCTNSAVSGDPPDEAAAAFFAQAILSVALPGQAKLGEEFQDENVNIAMGVVKFFVGLLLLYVPDRPYDPSLPPQIAHVRKSKRLADAQLRLDALKIFQRAFSGESESYRIRLAQEQLDSIGILTACPPVLRPIDGVLQLHSEMQNILLSIVSQIPTAFHREGAPAKYLLKINESSFETVNTNIQTAISRLSEQSRLLDDINKPLIEMLRGLNVGLGLLGRLSMNRSFEDYWAQNICTHVPFMSATPKSLSTARDEDETIIRGAHDDNRLLFLHQVALQSLVKSGFTETSCSKMLECFHSFYEEWKEHLEDEKKEAAARSSLFKYRDNKVYEEETSQQEVSELFDPNLIDDYKPAIGINPRQDPRSAAQRLAYLHQEIFDGKKSAIEKMTEMLDVGANEFSNLWSHATHQTFYPGSVHGILPVLLLRLEQTRQELHDQNQNGGRHNFYKASNISELRKLILLVQRIRTRFLELKAAWPEHATLDETLDLCHEIQSFGCLEPIAKVLPLVERLHGSVNEWQVVASKQYTAVDLVQALNQLIISWRRAELGTWSGLLASEDQNCRDDADAWWFLAYEVVIAASLNSATADEDMEQYAQHLISLLEDFVRETPLGQLSRRLQILSCFTNHIRLLTESEYRIRPVHNAMTNFLRHYAYLGPAVTEQVANNRQSLEKELKEVVLLASWKDTNVVALRESAKRSHYKLFRVVKKYREILALPISENSTLLAPKRARMVTANRARASSANIVNVNDAEIAKVAQMIPKWALQSARRRDPASTAKKLHELSAVPPQASKLSEWIYDFASSIDTAVADLRQETPTKATEKNAELVKRLQTRKRKLLADTLRSIRQMGFSASLSQDIFKRSSSTAKVLATLPPLCDENMSELVSANAYFDDFLDDMAGIRASKEYSEDLTRGEISRSINHLESMLALMISHRQNIRSNQNHRHRLQELIACLKNLAETQQFVIYKESSEQSSQSWQVLQTLLWLPSILEVALVILKAQSDLGGQVTLRLQDGLRFWQNEFRMRLQSVQSLPALPSGLSSHKHATQQDEAILQIEKCRTQIDTWIYEEPNVAHVLGHVISWMGDYPGRVDSKEANQIVNLSNFDEAVSSTVDSLLVAIQTLDAERQWGNFSFENPRWMMEAESLLSSSLRSLQADRAVHALIDLISALGQSPGASDEELGFIGAHCAMAVPIIEQFSRSQEDWLSAYMNFHTSLCQMASTLSKHFLQISREGFCAPSSGSATEGQNAEKLEDGTGLGEGEGAENVSKDVQEDEDLSELAQQKNDREAEEQDEQEDNAVNMDREEMDGHSDTGSHASEDNNDDEDVSEDEDADLDDEIGSVDNDNPTALDEKLWDDAGQNEEQDATEDAENSNLQDKKRDNASKDDTNADTDKDEKGLQAKEEDDDMDADGVDEDENGMHEEREHVDPHTQEEEKLDLPEDIRVDDDTRSQSSSISDSGLEDMSGVEDREEDSNHQLSGDEMTEDSPNESKNRQNDDDVSSVTDDGSMRDSDRNDELQSQTAENMLEASEDKMMDEDPEEGGLEAKEAMGQARKNAGVPDEESAEAQIGDPKDPTDPPPQGSAQSRDQETDIMSGSGPAASKTGTQDQASEQSPENSLKQLGDALERWHRQHQQILNASVFNDAEENASQHDPDEADQQFEHIGEGEPHGGAQALDTATEEQTTALEKAAFDSEVPDRSREALDHEDSDEQIGAAVENEMEDVLEGKSVSEGPATQSTPGIVVARRQEPIHQTPDPLPPIEEPEDLTDLNKDLSVTHLQSHEDAARSNIDTAHNLWAQYENIVSDLSYTFTERLRLVLAPTLATKLRGDYRTGKRLNMKRIIPYIASNYKRDKIWMRRSVPSKRNYQIMIAVDNSKSMKESGAGELAFKALALVSKSLTILEVGEICIMGFGKDIFVAHEFDKPFSSESGGLILQRFDFDQTSTNVRKLVADSIEIFREARRRQFTSGPDIWQIQLIISDGVCEDHETIRRLVQQALEERIMIVFVIVDALVKEGSILDMSTAVFAPDETTGQTELKMKRYLDTFPFNYYVVVSDVQDLPEVLSQALRQWFSEVAESG